MANKSNNLRNTLMAGVASLALANNANADLELMLELKDSSGNVATNYVKGNTYTVEVVGKHSLINGTNPTLELDFGLTSDGKFTRVVEPGVNGLYSGDLFRETNVKNYSLTPRSVRRVANSGSVKDIKGIVAKFLLEAPATDTLNIDFTNSVAYDFSGRQNITINPLSLKTVDYQVVYPQLQLIRNGNGQGEDGQALLTGHQMNANTIVKSATNVTGPWSNFYTNNADGHFMKIVPYEGTHRFFKAESTERKN